MSYEGYEQLLCPQGHYWEADAITCLYNEEVLTCADCGQIAIWRNSVDQTNDDGSEDVVHLVEKTPAVFKKHQCKCCDKVWPEEIEPETYHIPSDLPLDVRRSES